MVGTCFSPRMNTSLALGPAAPLRAAARSSGWPEPGTSRRTPEPVAGRRNRSPDAGRRRPEPEVGGRSAGGRNRSPEPGHRTPEPDAGTGRRNRSSAFGLSCSAKKSGQRDIERSCLRALPTPAPGSPQGSAYSSAEITSRPAERSSVLVERSSGIPRLATA